jgi:FHA domain
VATCPSGHESASDDFCDVCGVLIGAVPSLAPVQAPATVTGTGTGGSATETTGPGTVRPGAGPASGPAAPCPRCGVARTGQFCESCGYDFTVTRRDPGPPASAGPPRSAAPDQEWSAVVTADRAYYDSVQAAGGPDAARIGFPAYCPQRRFRLDGPEIRIGRRSTSSGISPDIDLSVPPADPGISRLHAVLLRAHDGSWSVLDPGSANGTVVNNQEIPTGQPFPLHEGDRIHLGAWTELRLVREQP